MRVSVEGGKYTYVITETNAHVLRYGKLWKDATGDKFTYCMAAEIESLREQVEKLTKERDALKTVPMKYRRMQFNAELQDEVTQLQKQLAEQNAKMRKALTKWRYLDSSYNWRCGHCGNEEGDEHKEGCALALHNLASTVLNRIRAEGMRMAAKFCSNNPLSDAHCLAEMLRSEADELEQSK